MKAYLDLRTKITRRWEAFAAGLALLGFTVVPVGATHQAPVTRDAVFITWNRFHAADRTATKYTAAGARVLVVENASWGAAVPGDWLHIARTYHNTAGMFPVGGAERWDMLNVALAPWRVGGETVVLAQRGLGSAPVACPRDFLARVRGEGRVRQHPGPRASCVTLEHDLRRASRVVTWGSAAAVEALIWGVSVRSLYPRWIAAQDNTDEGRLAMFRQLAWAQWRLEEIASGEALRWLL